MPLWSAPPAPAPPAPESFLDKLIGQLKGGPPPPPPPAPPPPASLHLKLAASGDDFVAAAVACAALALLGALVMMRMMPRTVKDRAQHNDPNYSVCVTLPFRQKDVYYEMLDVVQPLGAGAGPPAA